MLCVLIAGGAPLAMVAVELFSATTLRMTVPRSVICGVMASLSGTSMYSVVAMIAPA